MPKLQQINLAIDIAKQKEEKAAHQLGDINHALQQEQERLRVLKQYQQDYLKHVAVQTQNLINSALYQNLQDFIKTIQATIEQQNQQIKELCEILDKQHQVWMQLRTRTQALNSVLTNIKLQVQREENKREQQMQDELAMLKRKPEEESGE